VSRVIVIGGGVAGLATAHRLRRAGMDVTVLEAAERPGGKIASADVGGLELEAGPDSLVARKPWGVELCRELGLGDELVPPATGRAFVWTDRGLVEFPQSAFGVTADLRELLAWRGISLRGKLRAGADLFIRARRSDSDESIGSLVRRRLGDEVAEMLVEPLLGGLHAGDVDELSVQATFPELAAWERDFGSLVRGARAAMSRASEGPRSPMFLRPRRGVSRLVEALVASVGRDRIRTGVAVRRVRAEDTGLAVDSLPAEAVVIATPASAAAQVLQLVAPHAGAALRRIPYTSTAVALGVYGPKSASQLPEAAGIVVPRGKAAMTAVTFVSGKWPEERYGDRAVVRCFVGGAGLEDLLEASDDEILDAVFGQLAAVVALPERPEASRLVRWPAAMPQYLVGHTDLVREARLALPPGIFLVGSAYDGVGIADCARGAAETAEQVLAHLAGRREQERVR